MNREEFWFYDEFNQRVGFINDSLEVLESTHDRIFCVVDNIVNAEPLGSKFDQILHDNLWELYEHS